MKKVNFSTEEGDWWKYAGKAIVEPIVLDLVYMLVNFSFTMFTLSLNSISSYSYSFILLKPKYW